MIRVLPAVMLILAAPAFAGAPPADPAAEYETRWAELSSTVADYYFDIGEFLAGEDQFGWALEEYQRAVQWNPHHDDARNRLGYALVNGEWQRDTDIQVQGTNALRDADAVRVAARYHQQWSRNSGRIAGEFWDLARWCERNYNQEYQRLLRMACDYDPNHNQARRELGFEQNRQRGNIWMTEDMNRLLNEMRSHLPNQATGSEYTQGTEIESRLSIRENKRQSAHFLFESPHLAQPDLENLIRHAEQTVESYQALFGVDNIIQNPVNFVILQTEAHHRAYVDAFVQNRDPAFLQLAYQCSGLMGAQQPETYQGDRNMDSLEDHVVHASTQSCLSFHSGGDRAWLQEGLAYFFSKGINDTILTHCTNVRGTGGGGGRRFGDVDTWASTLRTIVMERSDPPFSEVLSVDVSALEGALTVKAWSLVDFLMFEHRERFAQFLTALNRDPDDNGERAFQEVFGWSLMDLDERWRTYLRETYPG